MLGPWLSVLTPSGPVIRSIAASHITPVGWPCSSRSMRPPAGSGRSLVMPFIARQWLLTITPWPERCMTATTRSVATRSRSVRSGLRFTSRSPWWTPKPQTSAVGGSESRRRPSISTRASIVVTSGGAQSTHAAHWPSINGCVCASTKPGRSVRPPRSNSAASRPAASRQSASEPTCRIRSSSTATASARISAAIVRIGPPEMTVRRFMGEPYRLA